MLGRVQGAISAGDQLVRGFTSLVNDQPTGDGLPPGDVLSQALHDLPCPLGIRIRQNDQKFLTAHTGQKIAGP